MYASMFDSLMINVGLHPLHVDIQFTTLSEMREHLLIHLLDPLYLMDCDALPMIEALMISIHHRVSGLLLAAAISRLPRVNFETESVYVPHALIRPS